MKRWERFVVEHGYGAPAAQLAFVTGTPVDDIHRLRQRGVCVQAPSGSTATFAQLFTLWHGRAPTDTDWPVPVHSGRRSYEWQAPEMALLASLVGQMGVKDIATALTRRLQQLTGDPWAIRVPGAIQNAISRLGLQSSDLIGGITTAAAGREIGSSAIINQSIHNGQLKARRVGRRWLIPHAQWEAWKAKRVFPPKGYVQLSSIRDALAIRSDKLSEFARMGFIPTALRCNPYGTGKHSTQYGTWFIDEKVARRLLADRHAGRPMPWHGQVLPDNLRAGWKRWQSRQHPASCQTCQDIWGAQGAPTTFDDYVRQYPPLAHGALRGPARSTRPCRCGAR